MVLFGLESSLFTDLALITMETSTILALIGQRRILKQRYWLHHLTMIIAYVLLGLFLIFYLLNYFTYGETLFKGPDIVKLIYFPFLIIHIFGAITMAVLTTYLVFTGLKRTDRSKSEEYSKFKYEPKYTQKHTKRGKWAFYLWYFTGLSGFVVYLFLYVLF